MTTGGEQLGLFAHDDDPVLSERTTASPRHAATLVTLRDRLALRCPTLRLGTSSWTFPGWSGLVYAPTRRGPVGETMLRRDGLRAYARHPLFTAVGVDRSFYAPLPADQWRRYAAQVPASFRFLVKADRALTTAFERNGAANPDFLDATRAIERVLEPTAIGLGDRLGVVAFQFPPLRLGLLGGTTRFLDRLEPFLAQIGAWRRNAADQVALAVELRNAEPYEARHVERVRDLLAAHDVRLIHCHHPAAPPLARQIELFPAASQPETIVRWMLRRNHQYEEAADHYRPFDRLVEPDEPTRRAIAALVAAAQTLGRSAWVIANNKAEGCSPLTIEALAAELAR